ncbi:serine hydrolase [Lactobacillus gasseri]|uniref:serine hydrolase n=1 Tax=Lactobacillus gasseri TaxID=1596 RepID=UPI0011966931|nr:serine hydrolase [Lactobacillus gasseri]TVU93942.1 serine hydrolase [Lactobacillus gasseri]TVV17139.1 serine hydrolase [Lactobacillus gasseri]UNL45143.1 serine hydrolase [Lactobacillus gasseri]
MQLTKIQKQIENNPWKTAITIRKNNQTIFETSNANMVFKSASLIKLGIALYIEEEKPDTIDNTLNLSSDDIVGGAGIINRLSIKSWQISDLLDLMLSVSDNTATNALLNYYNINTINDYLQQNFPNISLGRFLMKKSDKENTCTSNSMMDVFEKLLADNNEVNHVILDALKHQEVRNKLVAYSNPKYEVFNKTGELLHEQHDIARFKVNADVIDCCVLTNYQSQKDYENILNMMQKIGKILTH